MRTMFARGAGGDLYVHVMIKIVDGHFSKVAAMMTILALIQSDVEEETSV
jgi:predicted Co/Zn/Cd cation transporter (cation efflux family)